MIDTKKTAETFWPQNGHCFIGIEQYATIQAWEGYAEHILALRDCHWRIDVSPIDGRAMFSILDGGGFVELYIDDLMREPLPDRVCAFAGADDWPMLFLNGKQLASILEGLQ